MHFVKLIKTINFLARNNLTVKSLQTKIIEFSSNECEKLIIIRYLDSCHKNATYTSHKKCDSLLSSLDNFLWCQIQEKVVIFVNESLTAHPVLTGQLC